MPLFRRLLASGRQKRITLLVLGLLTSLLTVGSLPALGDEMSPDGAVSLAPRPITVNTREARILLSA